MLVFAEGIGGGRLTFDFRNPMDPTSELMMMMLAFAAQVEAQSIKDRVTGAMAAIRKMPLRWRGGGRPPYGYMPAPMPKEHGGVGWTLVPDPDAVKVIERIVRELLEGKTVSAIAIGLNVDQVPSPRDHWAVKNGRKTGGRTGGVKGNTKDAFLWNPAVITRMLRNPSLIGWKMHNGKPVRDAEGNPVMQTEQPIMTREEFDRIGAVLDSRSINNADRSDTDALLLRVIHCAHCGGRMYLNKQDSKKNQAPTYKCNSHARGDKCDARQHPRGLDGRVRDRRVPAAGRLRPDDTRSRDSRLRPRTRVARHPRRVQRAPGTEGTPEVPSRAAGMAGTRGCPGRTHCRP
ncbi:recombinase family protein [Streptomyces sp. NBC_01216]|uniref:recombinase family protein n=1 Tax=Streptomyces sp. NBC_01216 TaxID=2903778 RepID=UPI002E13F1C0|nr:recombinase family protein [Streptomyces sp. NBC_01216]